jgi:hypothetical protein
MTLKDGIPVSDVGHCKPIAQLLNEGSRQNFVPFQRKKIHFLLPKKHHHFVPVPGVEALIRIVPRGGATA